MKDSISVHALPGLFDRIVRLSADLERKPRKFGTDVLLSSSECHLVEMIGERDGMSVTEIAGLMGVTKGAVSQTLKRLESKGLSYKEEDPSNISRVKISLTNKGKTAYYAHKHWHETMDGGYKKFFENLSQEKVDFLYRVLKQVEDFLVNRLQSEE